MTASFAHYDTRGYRTLDVVAGYAAWAPFYDTTMDDRLDLPLLRSLVSVDWSGITAAVDLGCGTGRIGAWLKAHGVVRVDGVDACSAMLDRAAAKGIFDSLVCADAAATGLGGDGYDVVISSFAACHPRRPCCALCRGCAPHPPERQGRPGRLPPVHAAEGGAHPFQRTNR